MIAYWYQFSWIDACINGPEISIENILHGIVAVCRLPVWLPSVSLVRIHISHLIFTSCFNNLNQNCSHSIGLSESLSQSYCTACVQMLHEDYPMHQSWSHTPHVEGSFPPVAVSHVCLDSCPCVTWCSIAVPVRHACIIWLRSCVTVRSGAASSMLIPIHSRSREWDVLYLWAHFGVLYRIHAIGHVTFVQGFVCTLLKSCTSYIIGHEGVQITSYMRYRDQVLLYCRCQ